VPAVSKVRIENNPDRRTNKIVWPTDEELKELVWGKPSVLLAEELGVSDSAIGKRCKVRGITKPPRGYWANIRRNIDH
jgi:hypothetical protein